MEAGLASKEADKLIKKSPFVTCVMMKSPYVDALTVNATINLLFAAIVSKITFTISITNTKSCTSKIFWQIAVYCSLTKPLKSSKSLSTA